VPGLFCIISDKSESQNQQDLARMLECMNHETFYSKGTYIDCDMGLYAGWTALEDSFSDCMPIIGKNKKSVMLFSGENFTDSEKIASNEISKKAKKLGNANYLIDLYEDIGNDFFKILNGHFHGIICDYKNKTITIFNDRYSMKRLYYYIGKDEIIFSSEAKAILQIRPFLRTIDMDSLGEYFTYNCVLNHKTLFKNIFLLPGSSRWVVQNGKLKKKSYFNPAEWEQQTLLGVAEFDEQLNHTLKRIVPKYLESKQKIGLSLTGGLDTRMILSAVDIPPKSLPCFTYGGMYRDSYDVKVSKKIANACDQTHEVIRLGKDFFHDFESLAYKTTYLSDGLMDITGAPNLYVAAFARNIAPVRLTGNYGQEVLRRYIAFKPNPPDLKIFNKDFLPYISKAEQTYFECLDKQNRLTFALFKQAPWFQYSRYSIESSQMTQRSPFLDDELVKLVYRAPNESLNSENSSKKLIHGNNEKLGKIMTDLGKLGVYPEPLKKVIKLWRYFLFKMEWYYNHKLPWPLERADNLFQMLKLEKFFLGNHKYYHFRVWFRDELSDFLKQIMSDDRTASRGFMNSVYLNNITENHIFNNKSNTDILCTSFSVELMHRKFID
jgi:asparagine synthase (glutamine-hydrolysing)